MVLEKTFQCPLDYKEIQPVHPNGNQSWIFTGRTNTDAETPILWPPDGKNWLIGKDTDAGKDWRTSASVLPMNTQDWSPLGWTGWNSLQSKGLSSLLQHRRSKASIFRCSAFFTVQLSHPYMTMGKAIALTRQNFVGKVMSLLFNMLSRLVITFLPRSKHLLISRLQSPSAVILEPPKIKSDTVSTVSPSISHEVMDQMQ